MDFEFDRAERRREKERRDQERLRKQREAREERGRKIAQEAEEKRLAIQRENEEKEFVRKQREEEELLNSGGIRLATFLKPVPHPSLETDRVRLPPSVLESLIKEGAIDTNQILTFELALFPHGGETAISKTHCGVLEFTAAEGTIEIPVKAAIALCKDLGERAIESHRLRVRYVQIERFPKVVARVQPLMDGFHENGAETASIDLKSVLERVLSQSTTLSQGDWIPVRHEGKTYTLAVRELQPEPQALLINTDVEIDLMPSENFEKEIKRKEDQEAKKKQRVLRAQELGANLPTEPAKEDKAAVSLKARLPGGVTATRRFARTTQAAALFNWAESLLGDQAVEEGSQLQIVISIRPGESKIITVDQAAQTLSELDFGRSEVLNFSWVGGHEIVDNSVEMEEVVPTGGTTGSNEEWKRTFTAAEEQLDQNLQSAVEADDNTIHEEAGGEEQSKQASATEVFSMFVSKGVAPSNEMAQLCQKYLASFRLLLQLNLLESKADAEKALRLVEKYKGSSSRIADAMLSGSEDEDQNAMAVETPPVQATPEPPQVNNEARYAGQLLQLESLFQDRSRSELIEALVKHHGSIERAANELLL